jgi:hypothetical protein
MSISSEQYKTAIFEQCRRAIRVSEEARRVAYYDMVYKVLEHDGVVVDADSYNQFRIATEGYLNYLSDNNLLTASDMVEDKKFAEKVQEYWGGAFSAIGITMHVVYESGILTFSFTYQDGITESYSLTEYMTGSPAEMNIRFYSTLDYAQKVIPYWDIQPSEDTIPLNELAGNRASFVTNWEEGGLYWHYNREIKEIEFTGDGELKMVPSQFTGFKNGLGLGEVLVAIYGAGVNALPSGAFEWGGAGTTRTIVCLHGAKDAVVFPSDLADIGSSTSPYTLNIYCDNESIRSGTFGAYVVVNWYSLSEWTG